MSVLQVHLLGRFGVWQQGTPVQGLDATKAQELFSYLVLYRDRHHPREALAGLLWGDVPTCQSKKYLRQALWQVQSALDRTFEADSERTLLVEQDWVYINSRADLYLDVEILEAAFRLTKGLQGQQLSPDTARAVEAAVAVYHGDLLEGCYQDWSLYERQRFQDLYLILLGKLMGYAEVCGQYEQGIEYGAVILRHDRAHESTHRQLMRLHYLMGDRAAALRQYGRCQAALHEELDIGPSKRTLLLHDQICADAQLDDPLATPSGYARPVNIHPESSETLAHLVEVHKLLSDIEHYIHNGIESIELLLPRGG